MLGSKIWNAKGMAWILGGGGGWNPGWRKKAEKFVEKFAGRIRWSICGHQIRSAEPRDQYCSPERRKHNPLAKWHVHPFFDVNFYAQSLGDRETCDNAIPQEKVPAERSIREGIFCAFLGHISLRTKVWDSLKKQSLKPRDWIIDSINKIGGFRKTQRWIYQNVLFVFLNLLRFFIQGTVLVNTKGDFLFWRQGFLNDFWKMQINLWESTSKFTSAVSFFLRFFFARSKENHSPNQEFFKSWSKPPNPWDKTKEKPFPKSKHILRNPEDICQCQLKN